MLFTMLAAAGAAADATAALRAGAAVADITPQNGGTTLGFVRPDITVKGVRTRLTARALVLENGGRKIKARALRDGAGNTNAKKVRLRVGSVRTVAFPPPMGVGGGRTPGVGGEGSFPP